MPITYTYSTPGTGTYSNYLSNIDTIMSALPDNIINLITAKNIRDTIFTLYENTLSQSLSQVVSNGNTSSQINITGLQVTGTSSFSKNLSLLYTLSDKLGLTGSSGQVLSSINNGTQWITPVSIGGGTASLVDGTKTVTDVLCQFSSVVTTTLLTPKGTIGFSYKAVPNQGSFTVTSLSSITTFTTQSLDTSTFQYIIKY